MNIKETIKNSILKWRDRRDIKRYEQIMGDIENEGDPQKKLEKKVLLELRGTLLGGMASSSAYVNFKEFYFDKISSGAEQDEVKVILLKILKCNEYNLNDKVMASFVCSDLAITEAIPEIEKLALTKKDNSIEKIMFERSLESLKIGKSIYELSLEKLRQRGEL